MQEDRLRFTLILPGDVAERLEQALAKLRKELHPVPLSKNTAIVWAVKHWAEKVLADEFDPGR